MSDSIVEAKGIKKTLGRGAGQVQALRGIDLSLKRGELTLLMGPSGSGKTTLLLILGCMLAPSAGTATVCGTSTAEADKEGLAKIRRDHIGFVFQTYHLFPTLTAAQNVQLALDIRGERGRRAAKKAREALTMVGLEQKANKLPGELSGGEQQRVAIARAFVANPSVILADEPTAALDSDNGRTIHASFPLPIASSRSRTACWLASGAVAPSTPACRRRPHSRDGAGRAMSL